MSSTDTTVTAGDTAFLFMSAALVFIMTPGLALFYAGLSRARSSQTAIMGCMLAISVISIQWFFWGFSLTFSETSDSPFIGNMKYIVLRHVELDPHPFAPKVPALAFMFYQLMFAIITPALAFGSAAERVALGPWVVFLFAWGTLVYNVVAYWTWNANGWLFKLGGLDFAGGGPVHIASGFAGLAYCLAVGARVDQSSKAHSPTMVVIGLSLLWFGWFGFNGGSELAADGRAINACVVTNIAAAMGGLSWMLTEIIFHGRKMNSLSFCSGAVSGLVAITPASGFVTPGSAMVFGLVAGPVCYYACHFKKLLKLDDALDVWGVHGVGGLLGGVLTGFFAEKKIAGWGGTEIDGGWMNHHWRQMGIQIAGMCAIAGWSFAVSLILLKVINLIPGLSLRVAAQDEARGDAGVMGEMAWNFGSVANLFDQEKVGGLGLERAPTRVGLGLIPDGEPRRSVPRPHPISPPTSTSAAQEEVVEMQIQQPSPQDFERSGQRAQVQAQ